MSAPRSSFQAVVLGGQLSEYAFARELNDAYGIRPLLATAYRPPAIKDSRILERHPLTDPGDQESLVEQLVALGRTMTAQDPSRRLLLLANSESLILTTAEHREELERYFALPIPSLRTIRQVSDKRVFEEIARGQGVPVPRSHYVDLAAVGADGSSPDAGALEALLPPGDFGFPLLAKPTESARWEAMAFDGKRKVYFVESRQELVDLYRTLVAARFDGVFVVQEFVRGDDSCMRSVTAYVDTEGTVSLTCTARVLLQEHEPSTLGIPCAMITEPDPEILDHAERFLRSLDYRGFANFDVKRDSVTGKVSFLELNPRIGRNHFYVQGAGVNPMTYLVEDVVEGRPLPPRTADRKALYTVVPRRLLQRYLGAAERAEVDELYRRGAVVNPLLNPRDRHPLRVVRQRMTMRRYVTSFALHYPRTTENGF